MTLHLYKDPELTKPVSEGTMKSPDVDAYDGSLGESKDRELFLANEQTTLASEIAPLVTGIVLSEPRFKDGDILIVDQELMRIAGGGGTTNLAVQRGYGGTLSVAHAAGKKIYTGCNYTNLIVQPVDLAGSDEAFWLTLAASQGELDTRIGGDSLIIGEKRFDEIISIWRRFTVPQGTSIQNKTDIKLRITGIESLA